MATRMWVVGRFRCELDDGPVPRLCLYHQEALLRAVICGGREAAARESEELRRFVQDPLTVSAAAVRGSRAR